MPRFRLLDLLRFLRQAKGLLDIDMSEEGLREWLRKLVTLGEFLTDLTGTEWDDDALAVLKEMVESDEVYSAVYRIVSQLISDDSEVLVGESAGITERRVQAAMLPSDKPANPVLWITIISAVVKIIAVILERRREKN